MPQCPPANWRWWKAAPSQPAEGGSPELQHAALLLSGTGAAFPGGDAQRHRGGRRCLPPAASIFPLAPAQVRAVGFPPRADFLQALGQLVVSVDQQKSNVLALCFGTRFLASRQLSH